MNIKALSNKDRLRSRNVTRWHTVDTSRRQTVAEHSHCMSIIAESLLKGLYKNTNKSPSLEEKYWALKYSQAHDLAEIITGDISSVFKKMLKNTSVDFDAINDGFECQLVPEMAEVKEFIKRYPYFELMLKAADILEGLDFFKYGKGLDTEHNEIIERKMLDALKTIAEHGTALHPEFNWNAIEETRVDIFFGESAILNFETVNLVDHMETLKSVG